ncbi:MAG: hypothetical protein AAGL49_06795, partial [Pseudomonadota bacterium]
DAALKAAPENPVIAYRYAVALAALNDPANDARIRNALERAVTAPAKDALERAVQENARLLRAALGSAAAAHLIEIGYL